MRLWPTVLSKWTSPRGILTRLLIMDAHLPSSGVQMITTVRRYVTGRHLLTLIILTLFTNLFSLSLPVFSMQVFDRVLISGSLSTLALLVVVMSSIVACQAVVDGARAVMLSRV